MKKDHNIELNIWDCAWSTRRLPHAIQQEFRKQDFPNTWRRRKDPPGAWLERFGVTAWRCCSGAAEHTLTIASVNLFVFGCSSGERAGVVTLPRWCCRAHADSGFDKSSFLLLFSWWHKPHFLCPQACVIACTSYSAVRKHVTWVCSCVVCAFVWICLFSPKQLVCKGPI